jgi:YVTN family beta-propeller protein
VARLSNDREMVDVNVDFMYPDGLDFYRKHIPVRPWKDGNELRRFLIRRRNRGRANARRYTNDQSVSVIDTASNVVLATIAVGFVPLGMDTSPDGTRLYVVDGDPALNNGSVAVIDVTTNTLFTRVSLPAFHSSRRVAITPDGARGYVTINTPQRVLVFDTATNTVVGEEIVIDGIPEGIAITSEPTGALIPFGLLKSKLRVAPNSRHNLTLMGTFTLSGASDGIQPQAEIVRLSISDANGVVFEADLPAGCFKTIAKAGAIFHSSRKGSPIRSMRISAQSTRNVYSFQVLAGRSDFSRSSMPSMTLSLQIGNDAGSTTMNCCATGHWRVNSSST